MSLVYINPRCFTFFDGKNHGRCPLDDLQAAEQLQAPAAPAPVAPRAKGGLELCLYTSRIYYNMCKYTCMIMKICVCDMYIYIYNNIYILLHLIKYIYIYTYIMHIYIYIYNTYIYIYISYIYIYIYIYIHIMHIYIYILYFMSYWRYTPHYNWIITIVVKQIYTKCKKV